VLPRPRDVVGRDEPAAGRRARDRDEPLLGRDPTLVRAQRRLVGAKAPSVDLTLGRACFETYALSAHRWNSC
jgi:hypothetical protein